LEASPDLEIGKRLKTKTFLRKTQIGSEESNSTKGRRNVLRDGNYQKKSRL